MTLESLLVFVAVLVAGFFNIVLPMLKKAQRQAQQGPQPGQAPPTAWDNGAQDPALGQAQNGPAQAQSELPRLAPGLGPAVPSDMSGAQRMPFDTALKRIPAGRTESRLEPTWRRRPLGGLAEVRRGMVLRTVLGPCRAKQPFGAKVDGS